ncbi:sugar ABC transporter permease [Agrobacterium tumefaciens]|nr:sugar ABC transporter permease [Agrobacterium tumefaciens]
MLLPKSRTWLEAAYNSCFTPAPGAPAFLPPLKGPAVSTSTEQVKFAPAKAIPSNRTSIFRRIIDHRNDYLYVAPALLVMMFVIAYPIYYTIELSFFRTPANLQMKDKVFVGLDNYVTILSSSAVHQVTVNTLIWTFFSTLLAFALGLCAALSLHREFIGRGFLRAVLLVPYVISAVSASYVWKWLYHSDFGVIGALAVEIGLTDHPINFLDNLDSVLPSLIVVNVWKEFSFAMVMLLAGLQTVPEQVLRAARVDGANSWQRFWHVTFPHLKNVSMVTVLLLMVNNFNSFIIPWVMTGGGPIGASDIWITQIYDLAFVRQRYGVASAYAVILFIVMMTLGYFYVRALTRGDDARSE